MRPRALLLALLAGWGLLGVPVVIGIWPHWIWWAIGAGVALIALVDLLRLRGQPSPSVHRELPESLALNVESEATLRLESSRHQRVDVFDLVPGGWSLQGLPRSLALKPMVTSSVAYRLTPTARGRFVFEGVHLRMHSAWRLWHHRR